MEYSQDAQDFDFIKRTRKIIEQYAELDLPESDKYEVTLFLNCLVGLLIVPKEHWFEDLPESIITSAEWGIDSEDIMVLPSNKKTVKQVASHLRNSVAHKRFEVLSDSDRNLNRVRFSDQPNRSAPLSFETTISIQNLREFTSALTDFVLKKAQH